MLLRISLIEKEKKLLFLMEWLEYKPNFCLAVKSHFFLNVSYYSHATKSLTQLFHRDILKKIHVFIENLILLIYNTLIFINKCIVLGILYQNFILYIWNNKYCDFYFIFT